MNEQITPTAEEIADEIERWSEGDLQMAKVLRSAVAARMKEAKKQGKTLTDAELGRLAVVLEKAQKLAQLALGRATEIMESRIIG